MAQKKTNVLYWVSIIGATATIVSMLCAAIFSLSSKIAWQSDKEDILFLIRENEMLRREENICRYKSDSEDQYTACMEEYYRDKIQRIHVFY